MFSDARRACGRPAVWLALVGVVVAMLDYRCHAYFVNPDLRAEDGRMVFAHFYMHRGWKELFRFKSGYMPFVPNVLGYVAARLPPPAAPHFMTLAPAVLALAAYITFASTAFRRYVASDRLRACCCLGLAVVPYGTFYLVCHTDYSIWNLLLLLLWLVLVPMPRRKWQALLLAVLLIILIWSNPLSVVALPATLCWLRFDRRIFSRVMHALVLFAQGLHLRLGAHPQEALFVTSTAPLSWRVSDLLSRLSHHILDALAHTFFPYIGAVSPGLGQVCALLFLLALATCAVAPIRRVASRAFFAWTLYCIVVPFLLAMLVRRDDIVVNSRYLYVSRAFGVVGACALIWQAWAWFTAKLGSSRWLRAWLGYAPALIVLGYYVSLNGPRSNEPYGQLNTNNGRIIHACFERLGKLQSKSGSPCHLFVRCPKKNDWAFDIDTRRGCEQ